MESEKSEINSILWEQPQSQISQSQKEAKKKRGGVQLGLLP